MSPASLLQGRKPQTLQQAKRDEKRKSATLSFAYFGTADIFRGFMVSLYVKGKENGHVQTYAPTGAMGLKRWGGLTSKLDGLPSASDPHLWWQACP